MFSAQVWVNEEDQLRIISMQQGVDVKGVIDRLSRGIKTVGDPRPAVKRHQGTARWSDWDHLRHL